MAWHSCHNIRVEIVQLFQSHFKRQGQNSNHNWHFVFPCSRPVPRAFLQMKLNTVRKVAPGVAAIFVQEMLTLSSRCLPNWCHMMELELPNIQHLLIMEIWSASELLTTTEHTKEWHFCLFLFSQGLPGSCQQAQRFPLRWKVCTQIVARMHMGSQFIQSQCENNAPLGCSSDPRKQLVPV